MKMYLIKNKKSPYWQVLIKGNKGEKPTTVSTGKVNRTDAEEFLRNYKPVKKEKTPAVIPTIKLSSFFEEYKTYITNTYSEKYLKKAVIPSFTSLQNKIPDLPLADITTKIIDQYISSVNARSKFCASLYYRTLKAAFNKALVWNYLEANPFNKIKTPKLPKSLPLFISESELIEILNNTNSQLMIDIFTMAFYTGARLGELLNMKWNWIDFTQNIITIKNSNQFISKNKRERIIPIHQKVKVILQARFQLGKPENNLVFFKFEDVKLNEDFVSKQFKKAVRAAKLNEKIHFHTLRHSFASALVQRGISLYAIKELLGHANIKTTQIYSHL